MNEKQEAPTVKLTAPTMPLHSAELMDIIQCQSNKPPHDEIDFSKPGDHAILELMGRDGNEEVVWTFDGQTIPDHKAIDHKGVHIHAWRDMIVMMQSYKSDPPTEEQTVEVTASSETDSISFNIKLIPGVNNE